MYKLRSTWSDKIFPNSKLYALDLAVKKIDPAWPLQAPSPTGRTNAASAPTTATVETVPKSIHVNPRFLVQVCAFVILVVGQLKALTQCKKGEGIF